jgi:hypothetical protein
MTRSSFERIASLILTELLLIVALLLSNESYNFERYSSAIVPNKGVKYKGRLRSSIL